MFKSILALSLNKIATSRWISRAKVIENLRNKFLFVFDFYCDHRSFVTAIAIENTSACNRRCPYCPHFWSPRPKKLMPESLFKKIISDLSDLSYSGALTFAPWGEPLLDDRLLSFVQHAKSKIPKCSIYLTTNGDLLTLPVFRALVSAGVEAFDVSDHFNVVGDRYVHETPAQAIETYNRVNNDEQAKIHFHDFTYKRIRRIDTFHNRSDLILIEEKVSIEKFCRRCDLAESIMPIDYRGEVKICARQWHSSPTFGNITDNHIKDLWNGADYKNLRRNLRKGIFEIELCRNCGFGFLPDVETLTAKKLKNPAVPPEQRNGESPKCKEF